MRKPHDKRMTKRQRDAAIAAVRKGASPRAEAEKYGVSVQHIYFICKPEAERQAIIQKRLYQRKMKECLTSKEKESPRLKRGDLYVWNPAMVKRILAAMDQPGATAFYDADKFGRWLDSL